jgi:hypothetical protein
MTPSFETFFSHKNELKQTFVFLSILVLEKQRNIFYLEPTLISKSFVGTKQFLEK